MAPIRVGLIGLGKSSNALAPGAWASIAHLPGLLSNPKFEIVALANSSVSSAQSSITHHKLPSTVKAYGSPEDIAADPNVDLIVCSVMVTKHFALTKPALLAGKDVYVEWPLGASTAEAEELAALAREKGVRTVVGVQARADPMVVKIKELVDSGKIGKVISSSAAGAFVGYPPAWPENASYYLDIDSGANSLVVYFGHFLDSFIHILGGFESLDSILKVEDKTMALANTEGKITDPAFPRTSPDHIFVHGTLKSGAFASINYRAAKGKTASGVGVSWTITGTEGEIEIVTPEVPWQYGVPGTKILLRAGENDEVEEVDFKDKEEKAYVSATNVPSTNPARVYEAFAKRRKGGLRTLMMQWRHIKSWMLLGKAHFKVSK